MFGPKITTVFRSRWNALFWAASIMLGAYLSIPSADESKQDKADREAIEQAAKQVSEVDLSALNAPEEAPVE